MAGATLDSAAAFEDRARKVGLSETTLRELKEHGFATFGSLCFAVTSNPANLDDAAVDNWVGRIFNSAPPSAYQVSCIRRLMFEAQSLNIADLRARVDPPSESAVVRKLPAAERAARQKAQEARLQGIVFGPESSPSNSLVDIFVDMLESGVLSYIEPGKCTSRAQEIQAVKRDRSIQVEGDGRLRVVNKHQDQTCEVSTDARLRAAWRRRSLAMDQAGLCSFIEIERWVEHLFNLQCREVPKGWAPLTLQQLISADKAFFIHASENLAGNLVSVNGAPKPFDLQIKQLMYANEIVQHLTLLPKAEPPQAPPSYGNQDRDYGKGKGKAGKGKGGKTEAGKVTLPQGCVSKTDKNKPICFAFNRGKCQKKGVRCARGLHVCWKEGCYRSKPFHECTHQG